MPIRIDDTSINIGDTVFSGTPYSVLYIAADGTLAADNPGLIYEPGVGLTVVGDVMLDCAADRHVMMCRNATANTAGNDLTVEAGGATVGATDKSGGDLILEAGTSTGVAGSNVLIKTSPPATSGGLSSDSTIDLDPGQTYGGWVVGELAYDDYFGGGAVVEVATINGSGQPTSFTVITPGANYTSGQYLYLNDHPETKYITTANTVISGVDDNAKVTRIQVKPNGNVEFNPASGDGQDLSSLRLNDNGQVYALTMYSATYPLLGMTIDYSGTISARTLLLSSADSGQGVSLTVKNGYFLQQDANGVELSRIATSGSISTIANIASPQGGLGTYGNLLSYSEEFDRPSWVKTTGVTITANSVTAPNGTLTMDTITPLSTSSQISQTVVAPATGTVTASVWVQSAGSVNGTWQASSITGSGQAFTATTQPVRVTATVTTNSGSNISVLLYNLTGPIYVWGAQVEYASAPGPYIRTLGAAVTTTNGIVASGNKNVFLGDNAFGHNTPLYAVDMLGTLNGSIIQAPIAPSVATPTSGGSVNTGSHSWKVTYVTAYGETTPSSKSVVRSATASNKTFALTIPVGPTGVTARKIYRTVAGDTGNWKLVTTVANNTATTYSDTTADASLGADAPSTNTTGILTVATGGTTAMTIDSAQRVGIGTTTPATLLDISSTAPTFQMTDTTASAKSLRLLTDANVASFYEAVGAAGDILSLDLANNRAGVGTTAPSAKVHSLATTEQLRLGYDTSNFASFTVGSTGDMTVTCPTDKTVVLGETVWADIDFPIIVRTTGVGIPTLTTLNGNITMPEWAVNDTNICESQEFIHEWKEGTACYWHIHLTTNGLDATNRYVRFEVEYGWVIPSGAWTFPATIDSGDLLIPANTTTKTMFILSLGNFTPTGGKIGGHVVARLKRIAASGTAPTNNPWVPMLQLHIEKERLGSRTMTAA